ncbi:NAD-dependent epimerase/dehydratase family protein [Larkinella terrae]|uniref:NAD-dependent epimerase/dehydratase family protein n=1 Tax=Larkinella terrae TaxID=2025311 RepID=A0A7K0EI97_9BACT|nr:NAD(P)-dependent oxidoreductase [Larkinella terrae]MRS61560.1 NAD-dependent epimerase/dehydratase family protein [Larkinella terrae]
MSDLESLEQELIKPSAALVTDLQELDGDIIILGVGGKMGPSLARLAKKAIDQAGLEKRVVGVSRFSEPQLQNELEADGIETISADLLNETDLAALPDVRNVLYLAGTKFGTTGKEAFTWAMNAYLPGRVAEKYRHSRIVAFSTGNVYPFTPVTSGGATEETAPEPVGEYGQSCLGRERVFQYFAEKNNTPTLIYRLNYAIDLRYGVLLEIAKSVLAEKPIDLRMGNANVIWQGDANEIAIRALRHCAVPAKLLNVTGPETVSIQWLAQEYGHMLGKDPVFINEAQPTALLSNASQANRLFGYPRVTLRQMMELTVSWLQQGGKILNKPTHFQERTGKF